MSSASATSEYLRRLRTQLVAISSSAPKNSFAASVGLNLLRKTPRAWPSAMTSRMMPRYSRRYVAEKRSMNLVDCRSSIWKTTATARARLGAPARAAGLDRLLHRLFDDRDQQVVLAAEVQVDGAGGDPGGAGDVGDLGAVESCFGEGVDCGSPDRVAPVGFIGAVGEGGIPAGH